MFRTLMKCVFGLAAMATMAGCQRTAAPGHQAAPRPPVSEGYFTADDGARLFYRRVGNGRDALVYIHGGPASGFRGSGEFMEPLAAGRTLIMYDQRGAGFSETVPDDARLTFAHNVGDIEALRRHFGLQRMTLIALSFGAAFAASYAVEHPERVAGLILVSPMPPTTAHFRERSRTLEGLLGPDQIRRRDELGQRIRVASDAEIRALCREQSDITFRLYLAEPTPEKLAHAALRCDIPPATLRDRERVRRLISASLGEYDLRPIMARIRAPTLVIEGDRTNVPLEATRVWADTIPGARLLLIPNAGHEFFVDQPAIFVREAEGFLRATRAD